MMSRRRILTTLVIILVVAGGIYGLSKSGALNLSVLFNDETEPGPTVKQPPLKVRRPTAVANKSYTELLQEGSQLVQRGLLKEALIRYQSASEQAPREALPYEKIGDILFAQKDYQSAEESYLLAQQLSPGASHLILKRLRSRLGQRKILGAQQLLTEMPAEAQETLYYSGLLASFLNEQQTARESLKKSTEVGSDEGLRAKAQKMLTLYEEFDVAQEAPLYFLQALLANTYNTIGEQGLAIEIAFNALKAEHNYRDVWIVLGHAYLTEYSWLDAQDAFTKAIELDASRAESFFFRGVAEKNLGKQRSAIEDFEQAVTLGWRPKILAQNEMAESYFALGDIEKAYALYREVVTTDPGDVNRFVRPIALAINQLNKPAEARAMAQLAYDTHPDTARAHSLLGWALLANNELAASRQELEQALSLDPNLSDAWLNMGQLEERIGTNDRARAAYKKAVSYGEANFEFTISEEAKSKLKELGDRPNGELSEAGIAPTLPQTPTQSTRPAPSFSLE
ncbi:hypothetical protein CO046_05305 [Candidatus Peregrinibacteria bacterium CG_4_9_14_0_2_um_filter_53_11]|nr:MAG: hypothetical protein CO046_05305 [Candidatus Peregrinibacteria bacterium CG_4_9_14_0_2_um_filter_53_11]